MPFKEDFDRSPIDVLADKYGGGGGSVRSFSSVLSLVISVTTSAQTLEDIFEAAKSAETDEDTGVAPDGTRTLRGTIPSLHPAAVVEPGSVEITTALFTINDPESDGNLSGIGVTRGTIDYATGEWEVVFDAPHVAGANAVIDYTWLYALPANLNGLWFIPEGDIRATFSPEGVPTSTTGMLFVADAPCELFGQPGLIQNMKLIAGGATNVSIEVLV